MNNKSQLNHGTVEVKSITAQEIMSRYSMAPAPQRVTDPTVLACIKIIAETVGKLPAYLYRETETGDERIHQDKMLKVLTKKPNDFQTMQAFLEMIIYHLCSDGNFYAVIQRNGKKIVSFLPIENPSCVTPQLRNGELIYSLSLNPQMGIQGYKTEYSKDEVLHIKMASGTLLKGIGCIQQAYPSIALSQVQREHSLRFAEKSSVPAGIVSINDPEAYEGDALEETIDTLKGSFAAGATATGELAVMLGDVKFTPVSFSNADSQFLESRQFGKSEICAIFRVPEHFLSSAASVKYSNYGQAMLSFYTETISPYIARIQAAFNDHLDDLGMCFALDEAELKRGDVDQQRNNVTQLWNAGLITWNEARAELNRIRNDEGDRFKIQRNNEFVGTFEEIQELQRAAVNAEAPKETEPKEPVEEPENNNNNEGINNESEEKLPLQAE
ncbi:phage portal protein [Aeromonas hydrophila]|uniref:phage portal protein n=1 Tax=Aeromonas hydrophila TaxID=644 RepID=UPI00259EC790|nr:phage portal protein [Aeromonas hydrophila]MDM5119971.1 phage portal protein [Aeromonas hydrophila]